MNKDYHIKLASLTSGYDQKTCWVQARAGVIPGTEPLIVATMQKLLLSNSDVFFAINEMRSNDFGETWSEFIEHNKTLGRRKQAGGIEEVISDTTPKWHIRSGKLLSTGGTIQYDGNHIAGSRRAAVSYSVYNAREHTWAPYAKLNFPASGDKFNFVTAGCGQRVDEPDGSILLPVAFIPKDKTDGVFSTTVVRCAFDGSELSFIECGNALTLSEPRGLYEPSITKFNGRYFLTMRNDIRGYVAVSNDGLTFGSPEPWCFDDGEEIGNYNTQQHWVTHGDALYLVYTRRGLNNDHIFRHRAPLVMARVDTDKLCIIRETEQIVVPERGARLGNFGVCDINETETWIVVSEWMQTNPPDSTDYRICEKFGSDNTVFAARIIWSSPNRNIIDKV